MITPEQMPETAHVVDYDATPTGAPECVDDCPGCADDALSPTLRRLRDAIADPRPIDLNEALADARELLADHARELAALIEADIRADRERAHTSRIAVHAHRGGMMSARQRIDRYADDLDAAGGES